jgi:CRP-like cAMP-binding protein
MSAEKRRGFMQVTKQSRVELLRSVWLFGECSRRELDQLATIGHVRDVRAGYEISREGDEGREFVVIVDGKADVVRDGQLLATVGAGDFVGEMSLLDRQERVATVTTTEPSTLLRITAANFDLLLREMPSFARHVLTVVARRLRDVETRYVHADDHDV